MRKSRPKPEALATGVVNYRAYLYKILISLGKTKTP
jgi:hypothetical protein